MSRPLAPEALARWIRAHDGNFGETAHDAADDSEASAK